MSHCRVGRSVAEPKASEAKPTAPLSLLIPLAHHRPCQLSVILFKVISNFSAFSVFSVFSVYFFNASGAKGAKDAKAQRQTVNC
ncbi:MAG: hypothetical protein VSS75_001505 [Candidatus Parabeggiatoa sp.]|nr:hypothetical protein [Candidatus Parabeggiatoa sp.]